MTYRSNLPEVFFWRRVLFGCVLGPHPCVGMILIKLQIGFAEIVLLHGCSPVGLLDACRPSFSENASGVLPLNTDHFIYNFKFILFNKPYFWEFWSFSSFVVLIHLYLLLCSFLFDVSWDSYYTFEASVNKAKYF